MEQAQKTHVAYPMKALIAPGVVLTIALVLPYRPEAMRPPMIPAFLSNSPRYNFIARGNDLGHPLIGARSLRNVRFPIESAGPVRIAAVAIILISKL